MPHSVSARSIRNSLFLLLLRAFGIAVAFLVLFTLLVTGLVLANPSRVNPLYQLPITSRLETYYLAHGSWEGVNAVFDDSLGNEMSQWQRSVLLDTQKRVVVSHGEVVEPAGAQTYQASPGDIAISLRVNGKAVGSLVLQQSIRPAERFFFVRYLLPIFWASVILAVFAVLLGLLLTRRVVSPLADVIASAEEIAGGNLQTRIKKSRGPDVLRDLSNSFNKMADSLEQNDRERREMLTDIAHELRTPLTVIRGRLEGIMDGIYPADARHVGPALEETYLLERLVEDLRLLTLAESHQLPFEKREIDLAEIARRSLGMFQPQADESKIHLELVNSVEKALAIADPLRTEQVVGNLLANALHYVPQEGRIWIEIIRQGDELALSVNDTGPGIPEKDLTLIFKRFWRGEKSRSRLSGGAGLGLAIAKLLVEGQDGHIEARNLPGGGLQVIFFLKASE